MLENDLKEMQLVSSHIQLELLKGNMEWEDEKVQLFIPVVLTFTDFDWLKLIAEHICIDEDEEIVKNFLERVKALSNFNEQRLNENIRRNIMR